MPLGGFLVAIFAGWVIDRKFMERELGAGYLRVWRPVVRWVAPAAIGGVLALAAATRLAGG
jgi:NSS family neurotransmitter:Na+ symporter